MKQLAEFAPKWAISMSEAKKRLAGQSELRKALNMNADEAAKVLCQIAEKKHWRYWRTAKSSTVDKGYLKKAIQARESDKLKKVLPYRQSESRWAGEANVSYFIVDKGQSKLRASSHKSWSSNGKWSGTSSDHSLYLNPTDTYEVIGGLLTIFPKRGDKNATPCTWYTQGKGFAVNEKIGFLVDGYHIEISEGVPTLDAAKAHVDRVKARTAKDAAKPDLLTAKTVHKRFGFCEEGIANFCEIMGINPKGRYTREELGALIENNPNAKRFSSYLVKMGVNIAQ